ncbi:MAG: hypothetical protein GXW85_04930 [Clostridia bacterium]|nr:hypothetical protein [Clostridia bacterium]
MVVFEWLIKLFLWTLVIAFGSIFGMLTGFFGELILGTVGYWIGFLIGLYIFIIKCGPLLGLSDVKNINFNQKQPSLLSFLAGLWIGSKFFGNE